MGVCVTNCKIEDFVFKKNTEQNIDFEVFLGIYAISKTLRIELPNSIDRWGTGQLGKGEGKCCFDSFISDSL